jgi:hypothetical protein
MKMAFVIRHFHTNFVQFHPDYDPAITRYTNAVYNTGDGTEFQLYFRTEPVDLSGK